MLTQAYRLDQRLNVTPKRHEKDFSANLRTKLPEKVKSLLPFPFRFIKFAEFNGKNNGTSFESIPPLLSKNKVC